MSANAIYVRNWRTEIPGALIDEKVWEFPTVNSINSHGREMFWRIFVQLFDNAAQKFVKIEDRYFEKTCEKLPPNFVGHISVKSGVTGGKIRETVPTIVTKGKNIGKISETNVFTQALRDAYSTFNRQSQKAGLTQPVPGGEDIASVTLIPPMLAKLYESIKKNIFTGRVFIQRKYNGVRAVVTLDATGGAEAKVIIYSRGKKLYLGLDYIRDELHGILMTFRKEGQQIYFDGEIYKHGEKLQDIAGFTRRESNNERQFNFMIYDCFIESKLKTLKYSERRAILDDIFAEGKFKYCASVETFECAARDDIDTYYRQFLAEGFEGAIVRLDSLYKPSYNGLHCGDLLKIKPIFDHEFEVAGWETGKKGKAAAALMIICRAESGAEFPVTPALELEERIALAKKMNEIEANGLSHFENHWRGKKIIVTFDEYSKDKIPQRARTRLEIRTWD